MQHANKTRGTGPLGGAGMVGLWGASSLIASVQRGTGSYASTVTINAVDTTRSIVLYGNNLFSAANDTKTYWFQRVSLTNSTTLTFTLTGGAGVTTAGWQVIEFVPGVIKSVQRGTISIPGASISNTATITQVDTNKAFVSFLGTSNNDAAGGYGGGQDAMPYLVLTNGTTVTVARQNTVSTCVVSYEVIEWY